MRLSDEIPVLVVNDEPKTENHGSSSVANNHIYFYDEIDTPNALCLIENLRRVDHQLRLQRVGMDLADDWPMIPIWLHINSPGGSATSSFAIADAITRLKSPVHSVIEGMAASGGSLVSTSCTRRYITPNSFMLIHQLSGYHWGTYEQLKDDMKLSDMLMDRIVKFYAEHSNLSVKKVRKLLKRDSWFGANECLDLGMVDEIL